MPPRPKFASVSEEMKEWSALLGSEISSWPAVTSRRMFGMTAFYRKSRIFGVLPRTKIFETPNSIAFKLDYSHAAIRNRLQRDERIRKPSREKQTGWIGFELSSAQDMRDALKWFDLAYRNCLSKNNSKS